MFFVIFFKEDTFILLMLKISKSVIVIFQTLTDDLKNLQIINYYV